jgi:hypothetical protein
MIGTDQNFNYLDIEHHAGSRDLLDLFISSGFFPTISIPTRITHTSSTLIDNIYLKLKKVDDVVSGVISIDISDHLPLFTLIGKPKYSQTNKKVIKCRRINDGAINNITNHLANIDRTLKIENLNIDDANDSFTKAITNSLNAYDPERTLKLSLKCIIYVNLG